MPKVYPVIDIKRTGQKIESLRREHHYTVKHLQNEFGFATPNAIYKWQKGHSLPTIDNLLILSSLFHTSINDILVLSDAESA